MIFLGKKVINYSDPFIVAEISGNHNGEISTAFQLIEAAKDAGADAVKVQCYGPDDLTLNNGYVIGGGTPWEGKTLYELYQEASTPLEWMRPLFEHAKKVGIPIFSSVYSENGLRVLEDVGCLAYKIASYEANDVAFVKKVLNTGKPVVISTGMLSREEEERLYRTTKGENVIMLHCVSKYPTETSELGLGTMQDMRMMYPPNVPIGFSCHNDNTIAMCAAAVLGAAMIEVHLTADNDESPDYVFSYIPAQLEWAIKETRAIVGATRTKDDKHEDAARQFRRSLHVVKDITQGEIITSEHIASLRPATGCSPHLLPNIIGRKAKMSIRALTPMSMEYVE